MQPENRTRLEKYRKMYEAWVNDQVLYNMDGAAKNEILEVIRQEWAPGYVAEMWCGSCLAKMIVFAFQNMDKEKTTVKIKFK